MQTESYTPRDALGLILKLAMDNILEEKYADDDDLRTCRVNQLAAQEIVQAMLDGIPDPSERSHNYLISDHLSLTLENLIAELQNSNDCDAIAAGDFLYSVFQIVSNTTADQAQDSAELWIEHCLKGLQIVLRYVEHIRSLLQAGMTGADYGQVTSS